MFKKFKSFIRSVVSDNNDINEKALVGFSAFLMLVVVLVIDIVTGLFGKELPIHEYIFDGFMIITLGALGIASFDKILRKSENKEEE